MWYNIGRLPTPFVHVVVPMQRVSAGSDDERVASDQTQEFGIIGRRGGPRRAAAAARHRGCRGRRWARARTAALPGSARGTAGRDGGGRAVRRRACGARARGAELFFFMRARPRPPALSPSGGGGA